MNNTEFLLFGKLEEEKQKHCQEYDPHEQNKHFLVLQHSESRASVLQILQLQYTVNKYIGCLPLQMYDSQMFRKLIEYQKYRRDQHIYK